LKKDGELNILSQVADMKPAQMICRLKKIKKSLKLAKAEHNVSIS